jgi:hypothetical protein
VSCTTTTPRSVVGFPFSLCERGVDGLLCFENVNDVNAGIVSDWRGLNEVQQRTRLAWGEFDFEVLRWFHGRESID